MSSPSGPHPELERRYRRLLRLFPAHYRRAWEEELVAVLMQAASPGQRQVQPAEAVALLWQASKAWTHTAVSADRNANHQGAAILTVTLPLLLLFPAAKAGAEQLIYGSSSWSHHYDLIAWAIWIPAAVATAFGPARIAHWIAGLATLAYVLFLITPVKAGDTGTVSTSFGWLLIQFTALRLLTSPARVRLGRRLLWRGRRAFLGAGLLAFFAVAGPSALFLLPGSTQLLLAALTIALIVAAIAGLRTPVGRVLVTAGSALFAGFVAGHGWWTGIDDIGLLLPNTNHPTAGALIWLLLLPILAWSIFRIAGSALSRSSTSRQ